jgi:outer membrane protein OmpA-like peptidoglycan-associated protein
MKRPRTNETAMAKGPTTTNVGTILVVAALSAAIVATAYAAPPSQPREVNGKIAVEAPRSAEAARPSTSISEPQPKASSSARTTPAARFTTTALSDNPPPLKLDTEFASAKRIVPFAINKVGVGPRGTLAVRELLPMAKRADKVYVRGRTDGTGTTVANRKVAHDRAYTVFKAFRNGGVERKKLRLTYCSNCFIASNDTEEGRRLNRRVEVELIMPRDEIARLPKPMHAIEAPPPVPLTSK